MLRRIPAVKWAFTRLRPLPHSGSIDAAPIAANNSPTVAADVVEAAPTLDAAISGAPRPSEAEIAVATPVAEDDTVTAESPSAAPTDIDVGDHPTLEMPADVKPAAVEEAAVSSVESEPVDAPQVIGDDSPAELLVNTEPVVAEEAPVATAAVEVEPIEVPEPVISSNSPFEFQVDVEPVVAEEAPISSAGVATASADAPVVDDNASHDLPAGVELAVVDDPCVALADSKISAEGVAESSAGGDPSPSVAVKIEPVLANDSAPVTAIAAADSSTDAPSVVTDVAPEPVLATPAPEILSARKPRSKVAEPVDRAALIRQRWAETGIRMWNPRLHGTGDATLNIQGSIGLLPPAPGETMPRYDKLEFRVLGGQIVCEGVILEAPAPTGHRSFTRLAEPRNLDRTSSPMRERQAALA
ncbi:hypothetical protein [Bradyrhizobium cajani]|uniref:Uncharacterized protein n=1 Tax=Bradyrhizobium cajani TaxID=1928661 RepID=A0A844T5U9_9BRAD|nr:hypothetical protein [Bradyrhizobium cajani]MCP3367970.1 hypothetical protein [Bradyrhizobium cajani]MVT71799.1 hypothetical protein [Bradyrhizobium cajani]